MSMYAFGQGPAMPSRRSMSFNPGYGGGTTGSAVRMDLTTDTSPTYSGSQQYGLMNRMGQGVTSPYGQAMAASQAAQLQKQMSARNLQTSMDVQAARAEEAARLADAITKRQKAMTQQAGYTRQLGSEMYKDDLSARQQYMNLASNALGILGSLLT